MPSGTSDRGISEANLNLLHLFAVVADEGSVARAAQRLGVTQSAVSHALRRLRELFDDPLLVRGNGGLVPTPRAEQILPGIRRGLAEIERALLVKDAFEPATDRSRFVIAATDHMASVLLHVFLWTILPGAPGISVKVVPWHASLMADQLARDEIDLAIGPAMVAPAGLRQRLFFRDPLAGVVRRGHPRVQGALTLEHLRELPHLVLAPDDEGMQQVEEVLRSHGVERQVRIEVPYHLVAPALVPNGDLLLLAPRTLGGLFAFGYPIDVLDLPIELPALMTNLYWHERRHLEARHRWLREHVVRSVLVFLERVGLVEHTVVGAWPQATVEEAP